MQFLTELLRAGRALRASVGRFCDARGMSELHLMVLWQCARSGPDGVNQRTLAELFAVSPAQISALVEQMRREGFIAAHRPPHDRRLQNWHLAAEGLAVLELVASDLQLWSDSFSESISPGEIHEAISWLQQVITASGSLRVESQPTPRIERGAA